MLNELNVEFTSRSLQLPTIIVLIRTLNEIGTVNRCYYEWLHTLFHNKLTELKS